VADHQRAVDALLTGLDAEFASVKGLVAPECPESGTIIRLIAIGGLEIVEIRAAERLAVSLIQSLMRERWYG
jgi:hypothetical protein